MAIKHKAVKASGDAGLASEWNDDHEITGDVDFEQYEAKQLVVDTGVAFPAAPIAGQIFYRSDEKVLYYFDGVSWNITGLKGEINKCGVERNVNYGLNSGAWYYISFIDEEWDYNDMWSAGDDTKIHIKEDGYYLIIAVAHFDVNATGDRLLVVEKNVLVPIVQDNDDAPTNVGGILAVSKIEHLAAGDYVRLKLMQNSGILINSPYAMLEVVRLW